MKKQNIANLSGTLKLLASIETLGWAMVVLKKHIRKTWVK